MAPSNRGIAGYLKPTSKKHSLQPHEGTCNPKQLAATKRSTGRAQKLQIQDGLRAEESWNKQEGHFEEEIALRKPTPAERKRLLNPIKKNERRDPLPVSSSSSPSRTAGETILASSSSSVTKDDLFEPLHRSPLSVREDPDTGKLFLRISPRASPLKQSRAKNSPTSSSLLGKRSQSLPGVNEDEQEEEEDQDGEETLLTPGRHRGKRIRLGSADQALSSRLTSLAGRNNVSPLGLGSSTAADAQTLRSGPLSPSEHRRIAAAVQAEVDEISVSPDKIPYRMAGPLAKQDEEIVTLQLGASKTPGRRVLIDDEDEDENVLTPQSVRASSFAQSSQRKAHGNRPEPAFAVPAAPSKTLPEADGSFLSKVRGPYEYVSRPRPPPSRTDSASSNPFDPDSKASLRDEERLKAQNAVLPPPTQTPSTELPLPPHYQTLKDLHDAIETALVAHFATSTSFGLLETVESQGGGKRLTLPKVICFSSLQTLVRQCRTGARAHVLGRMQFAQLGWLWSNGEAPIDDGKRRQSVEEVKGLGMVIRRTRIKDSRTGKDAWDWSVGVEVDVHRPERPSTPPPIAYSFPGLATSASSSPASASNSGGAFGSSPSTPSRSRSDKARGADWSPANRAAVVEMQRDQMSISTCWQAGVEARKQEVARRLRIRAAQHMEAWQKQQRGEQDIYEPAEPIMIPADQPTATPPATPKQPSHSVAIGAGGLLTPTATRSPSHKAGARRFRTASHTHEANALREWPAEWPLQTVPAVPQAVLPSLKDDALPIVPSLNAKLAETIAVPTAIPADASALQVRSMSLEDRIRAKEQRTLGKTGPAGLSRGAGAKQTMQRHRDAAVLSRLPKIAETLVNLFGQGGPTSRFPRKSAREVLTAVKKVLQTGSDADARTALDMIQSLAPGFLAAQTIQGQGEYFTRKMGGGACTPAQLQQVLRDEIARVSAAR